jgi:hypothetical protein
MKPFLRTLKLAVLMLALSAKAFVPNGMMLDTASFVHGGNLVTICPSVGRLPWMLIHFDHDHDSMDQMASKRCPYAALDIPVSYTAIPTASLVQSQQHFEPLQADSLYRNLIEKRSARAPPVAFSFT